MDQSNPNSDSDSLDALRKQEAAGRAGGAECHESTHSPLPPSELTVVDSVCDEFETAWRAGQRPRIEDFVDRVPGSMAQALFRELLEIELQTRRKAGESPRVEDYIARFP